MATFSSPSFTMALSSSLSSLSPSPLPPPKKLSICKVAPVAIATSLVFVAAFATPLPPPPLALAVSLVSLAPPSTFSNLPSSTSDSSIILTAPPLVSLTSDAAVVVDNLDSDLPEGSEWRYSELLAAVKKGKVEGVKLSKDGSSLELTAVDGRRAKVTLLRDSSLVEVLAEGGVDILVSEVAAGGANSVYGLLGMLGNLVFPVLSAVGLFLLFRRSRRGGGMGSSGGRGPMEFGQSKSKFQEIPQTGVSFADVAGCDQAKMELQEVVDFLKNPEKYTALGARIPKGCLLVGPPGTGKTLLARAVAGEAGVPFFSCAASEFVELFVGVGASRVRDLFEKAQSKAPCIIFIDEIDAVGRQRGAGMGGGNDEREQTVNQLLAQMDGFTSNNGVIVLAATNRPDILDSALLRPGRFDRQVAVDRPDSAGRVKILQVHSKGKVLDKDVDLAKIARRTPGFTGADLENLMNEAAILAARRELKEISKDEIADALERIIAGPEKKNAVVTEDKRKLVAYHEAGHALVGALMPEYDPVAKISIIPRGGSGGLTFFVPSEERLESGLYSRSYLENQMSVALGGRAAEEVIFGAENVTTGASSDFQQVSRVARQMVERFGFSKRIGQLSLGGGGGDPFLGQQMSPQSEYSKSTANMIDSEVRELVDNAYKRTKTILTKHIDILHKLAQLLIEKESVDGEEFMNLFLESQAELFLV